MGFGILYDERFLEHHDVGYHPECPERLVGIRAALEAEGLWSKAEVIRGREASLEELQRVHSPRYVERALVRMADAPGHFDADTFFSKGSRAASLLAAEGTIDLVQGIVEGRFDGGFALPRPPGHHATQTRAMGFCIFNNIALAARAALQLEGVERVLIFDWDVHHGNGTQDAFWDDDRVFFISVHQWPFFPGSGLCAETGEGKAEGFTANFPLPPGAGNAEYSFIAREVVVPLIEEFGPGMVLVSAGFDAHRKDPLGSMRLDEDGYSAMTALLRDAAARVCKGRMALVLEGGYDIVAQGRSVASVVRTMMGAQAEIPADAPRGNYLDIIDRTRSSLSHRWKNL